MQHVRAGCVKHHSLPVGVQALASVIRLAEAAHDERAGAAGRREQGAHGVERELLAQQLHTHRGIVLALAKEEEVSARRAHMEGNRQAKAEAEVGHGTVVLARRQHELEHLEQPQPARLQLGGRHRRRHRLRVHAGQRQRQLRGGGARARTARRHLGVRKAHERSAPIRTKYFRAFVRARARSPLEGARRLPR